MLSVAREEAIARWLGDKVDIERRVAGYVESLCDADDVVKQALVIGADFRSGGPAANDFAFIRLVLPEAQDLTVSHRNARAFNRIARMTAQAVSAWPLVGAARSPREERLVARAEALKTAHYAVLATLVVAGAKLALRKEQFDLLLERVEEVVTMAWAHVMGILDERVEPTLPPTDEPFVFPEA